MEIQRSGSVASGKGPADWFTSTVRIDPLFSAPDPARADRRARHLRARRAHGVAHPSARPDPDREHLEASLRRLGADRAADVNLTPAS